LKVCPLVPTTFVCLILSTHFVVAPHYFKPADLEQLAQGDKKMPKALGASSSAATPS